MIKRRFVQGLLILALLCGAVLLAHPSAAWAAIVPEQPKVGNGTESSPYQISSKEELYWFAGLVNGTLDGIAQNTAANAVLTTDIDLNGNESEQWTPIGDGSEYTGTFDGNGHEISGLYINSDAANAYYVGLFGCIGEGGTVKNLALADSYISSSGVSKIVGGICGANNGGSITSCSNNGTVNVNGGNVTYVGGICGANNGGSITSCSNSGAVTGSGNTSYVGGICGWNNYDGSITTCSNSGAVGGGSVVGGICGWNYDGSITSCSNSGAVTGSGSNVGGICGWNYDGSITSCSNSGDVSDSGFSSNVGGICGYNYGGSIENCSNIGTVTGTDTVGGICGRNSGSIENCDNIGTVTGSDGSTVGGICGYNYKGGTITTCYWLDSTAGIDVGGGNGTNEKVESKTTERYASGEVAWLLNEESTNGPWRQNLGEGGDSVPTLDQTHGVVVFVNGAYHNCTYDVNGICTICRSYEPAVQDGTGNYQIENAGQLYWFAELVNGGQTTANAVLTDNITINNGVLKENGELNGDGSSFTQWTPIGDGSKPYVGTFDGQGRTISGLYIDSDAGYAGLFGYIGEGGTAKNLNLADSYIYNSYSTISTAYVGGICGWNDGGNITSCSNSGTVSGGSTIGTACVGGICGRNDGSIENCSNSGTVSGSITNGIACVGGICGGNDGSIENCSNSGTVSGSITNDIAYVGGICGLNANGSLITTCSNSGDVTGSGKGFVGGICGENYGSITNCSNSGPVTGSGEVGGICGRNTWGSITSGTITNCSNSGPVTVHNSSSSSTAFVGGICGLNRGSITNCYWLDSTAKKGVGVNEAEAGATVTEVLSKTVEQYASGEVAWLLNQGQTDGPWRQNLSGNDKDEFPTLDPTHDTVVQLTFNANTGKEEEQPIIRYGNVGDALPKVTLPEITGYTFGGWYDNEALSGDPVTTISANATGDQTYWAKWTAETYSVKLNTNGGTVNSGNVTNYTYGTETTLPTDVTRAGYTFGGWYENEALSGEPETVIPADATGDKEYWAKWTAKSYPSAPTTVSEETIDAIKAADPGETVTVDLSSGSTTLDKDVFETLAGKDVTLVVDLGGDVSWTVNGSDIPEDADFTDIDMGVTMNSDGIPVDIINAITGEHGSVQVELAHNGAFGFTMTLTAPLGAENAGLWANLYYYDEDTNAMTFETAAQIGSDGSVSLAFSHASQYAIVIDDHNHGVVTLPFTDVSEDDWFYDPVCYVYSQGLMTGTSATTFEPNTHLSRAMLVAVLHRLEGSPQASAGDFTDVASGDWYAQAVNWAASVGVVNGFDDGTFQPNAAITREQLAAILRNYAEYKGLDVTAVGDLSTYSDAASVSAWAKDSVVWAVGSGLLGGYEDSTLRPQGTTTRAEVASVLQRYLEK